MPPPFLRPRATIAGVPVHAMLVPFPIVCFVGAMLADMAYVGRPLPQWTNFAAWFLAFGALFAGIAAVFGLVDYFGNPPANRPRIGLWHLGGNALVFVLAMFNNLVHTRDGWTSVYPTGITLSVLTVIVLIGSGFLGHRMAWRHTGGRP